MKEKKGKLKEKQQMKVTTTAEKIEVIRRYMEKHDLSAHKFIQKHPEAGISRQALDDIMEGKTKKPADQTILDLLHAIGWGTHLFPEP